MYINKALRMLDDRGNFQTILISLRKKSSVKELEKHSNFKTKIIEFLKSVWPQLNYYIFK